jgi:hypothetical protein
MFQSDEDSTLNVRSKEGQDGAEVISLPGTTFFCVNSKFIDEITQKKGMAFLKFNLFT